MKKFALGILSVFMILGGVLLSACDKKVTLSLLSDEEIVIYTNDEQAENYGSDDVEVKLENSSAGIRTEILKGNDIIELSIINKRSEGYYNFTVSSLTKKSGEAEIKVSSIEDASQSKIIYVHVNTIVEDLTANRDDSVDARTKLFVVKELEKDLDVLEYFDFKPVTANVYNIVWTIEKQDPQTKVKEYVTELLDGDKVLAKIENGKLFVSKDYALNKITLRAEESRKGAVSMVDFEVLSNSTIDSLYLDNQEEVTWLYKDGDRTKESAKFELVRNDANLSSLAGNVTISTVYNINLEPVVYLNRNDGQTELLSRNEYEQYLNFNITSRKVVDGKITYSFTIDALDALDKNVFANLSFFLKVGYKDYAYDILTGGKNDDNQKFGVEVFLDTYYIATSIEVTNKNEEILNNSEIDIFSYYTDGNGYKMSVKLLPDNIDIKGKEFYISVDINQDSLKVLKDKVNVETENPVDAFVKFFYRNKQVNFIQKANGSSEYVSDVSMLNDAPLYVLATAKYLDVLDGVTFKFISSEQMSNAKTEVKMNFYQVSPNLTLDITCVDENNEEIAADQFFVSSKINSNDREKKLRFKIDGISKLSGLTLKTKQSSHFAFSNPITIKAQNEKDDTFIIVETTLNMTGYDFEDEIEFYFEHITGKISKTFKVSAYVPLQDVTIRNKDSASSDVFKDVQSLQNYVFKDNALSQDDNYSTVSLSNLMLEAGSTLPMEYNIYNATLSDKATYKFMTFENFVNLVALVYEYGIDQYDEAVAMAEKLYINSSMQELVENYFIKQFDMPVLGTQQGYNLFQDLSTLERTYFTIDENKLSVLNEDFRGFVCVLFSGYSDDHDTPVTVARFFSLEGFHSVRYLNSSVKSADLYTTETLSYLDMDRASVDVSISFRPDDNVPTYTNDIGYFSFKSVQSQENAFGSDFYFKSVGEDGTIEYAPVFKPSENTFSTENKFYTLSDMSYNASNQLFKFKITANSTNLQTQVRDILKITYTDLNGFVKETEIQIQIRNVKRIESVQCSDTEVYLNLTSSLESERNYTITTTFAPSDANDTGLSYLYQPIGGSSSDLKITTSSIGQTFNLNINTNQAGYGNLFLLPNDMVKRLGTGKQVLIYKYSVDEQGKTIEQPIYFNYSELPSYYDALVSEEINPEFSNYFLNNDGEKIYYKDIIKKISVTIADGSSENTAIRLYSEQDLKMIDYAKYYKIMNNITLTNWDTLAAHEFTGMFAGKDETITLKFEGDSKAFVDTVGSKGTIKDLTFSGNIFELGTGDYGGFVARKNLGTIDNVAIDVYYDKETDTYKSSEFSSSAKYIGGIVGQNKGTIKNSKVLGMTISEVQNSTSNQYIGGIAGTNMGLIEACGVEFYKFSGKDANKNPITYLNKFSTNETGKGTVPAIGGIVGYADNGLGRSAIKNSYVYAYSLEDVSNCKSEQIMIGGNKAAFVGGTSSGDKVVESLAFVGDLKTPVNSSDTGYKSTYIDSYISYIENSIFKTRIFDNKTFAYTGTGYTGDVYDNEVLTPDDLPTEANPDGSANFVALKSKLAERSAWVLNDLDQTVNFGYFYLKNTYQSVATNVSTLQVAEVEGKSLNVGQNGGILFVYKPTTSVSTNAQASALTNFNTIKVSDLFGITSEQARNLLLTSESKAIALDSTSIRVISKTVKSFDIVVHSKMDFTSTKTFKFVILDNLPKLATSLSGINIKEGQTILLQKGEENFKNVVLNLDSTIYLSGTAFLTEQDEYVFNVEVENNNGNLKAVKSGRNLVLTGLKNHLNNDSTKISTYLSVSGLEASGDDFVDSVKAKLTKTFYVSVYNGATSLAISDASTLSVKPSQAAGFEVIMETDNVSDNLMLGLNYLNIEIQASNETENSAKFKVDEKLTLDVSWTKEKILDASGNYLYDSFKVLVSIDDETKHLVDKSYDLEIVLNATSQRNNEKYQKKINLTVNTQEINALGISTYRVESRQIKNSVLYILPSSTTTSTLSPSSDSIVMVTVDPAYALMSHFTLTYDVTGEGNVGTVTITRLSYNSNFGYYVNPKSTSIITNGIKVDLTEEDKKGDGVFVFRIYISSAFQTSSDLKLSVTYYDENNKILKIGSHNINVDYLQEADIRVNGVTTYLMSKGSQATITVTVGLEQTLDDLYLQNNGANLSLVINPEPTLYSTYKVYTATLTAYVDAKLSDGSSNGIFYAYAVVSRNLNGKPEIKSSRATICLVDFAIDGNGISVKASGETSTYNNKTYDVFTAYISAPTALEFNYPMLPEEYLYNKNDVSEVEAVKALQQSRDDFALKNYHLDNTTEYYINAKRNNLTGKFEEMKLKQQLWYAVDENNSSAIYNGNSIIPNQRFEIVENEGTNRLEIVGQKTGRQLMKLQTTVWYQGIEFVYDYYFLIVVDVWSDEDAPTQIDSAEKFIDFATNSEKSDDYILMNDIVLNDYSSLNTDLIDSLDGNGFTIHINSFNMPSGDTLNLALFDTVTQNTTLKNVRVNIYQAGQIYVNINQYTNINIAGFALTNEGVIYNCDVVSYYDEEYQTKILQESGLIVKYTLGENTDPIEISDSRQITSQVTGFVNTNNASIMNSRVGGESFRHIITVADAKYIKTQALNVFVLEGQGEVAGFVNKNGSTRSSSDVGYDTSTGYISACFVDNIQINNKKHSTTSTTAGFVLYNYNNIQGSYVEGQGDETDLNEVYNKKTNIASMGVVAGFVYSNDGLVKNSYSNIAIENDESRAALSAGFVYMNNDDGEITLCYAASDIAKVDVSEMLFSGVNESLTSLNNGTISFSYYYNETREATTMQSTITTGALPVSDHNQDTFYGFSFSTGRNVYDGIWDVTDRGITLVSANQIALSNRYAVTANKITNLFYSKNILDANTLKSTDLSYGSRNNPIIIRDAEEFAKATGKATEKEISSYKEFYNDTEVRGSYRLVNNIDLSEIDQNEEKEDTVQLKTTKKTFKGLLDGNGFTIYNINLGSSETRENYGLFAKLENAVIMNLDLIVETVHNKQANIVGTLAGTAINTKIMAVNLSPVSGQNKGNTSILGKNVVGGVVGMLFGQSKMHDVKVKDIDIYSSYYKEGKTITSNADFTGRKLREYVVNKNSLINKVQNISYAGAIVGYIDVYDELNSEYVKFNSSSLQVSDFDIVTVNVDDAVDIYGEVAGGLFGYVGDATLVYDASLVLNANQNLDKPSYIISKNLYAGGLIGENYGGLFAVHAEYSEDLQKTIEENENSYYNGSLDAEKGQQSIFSYTSQDDGFYSNTNNPLFIGGIAGYMGGGYIYVGYNKLNVISHSKNTLAVGGIVGFAGLKDTQFDLTFLQNRAQKANLLLYDVYSSGDIYCDGKDETGAIKGVSAGLVGAIESSEVASVKLALKNAMAVNYYSYDANKFVGDNAEVAVDGSYTAENHFMTIGKILKQEKNALSEVSNLKSSIFVISSDDNYFDILQGDASTSNKAGSSTVGGYSAVKIGQNELKLNPYGFGVTWIKDGSTVFSNILQAASIGDKNLEEITSASARMYSYFLPIGWTNEFWVHQEGQKLFPQIELTPKVDVLFWDAPVVEGNVDKEYHMNIINQMRNSSVTVVVRGKRDKNDETSTVCGDIDLTWLAAENGFKPIENYSGTLISYYEYTHNNLNGIVSAQSLNLGNSGVGAGGAKQAGQQVGIILNSSLFTNLSSGAIIQGVTFYYYSDKDPKTTSNFSIIQDNSELTIIRNVNVVLNNNVNLKTVNDTKNSFTGLIVPKANHTSIINLKVKFRPGVDTVTIEQTTESSPIQNVYLGFVTGWLYQNSATTQVSVQQIEFVPVDGVSDEEVAEKDKKPINVSFVLQEPKESQTIYAGLYAGKIEKGSSGARISMGLSEIDNVNLSIEYADTYNNVKNSPNAYIGGYAGQAVSLDSVALLMSKDSTEGSVEIEKMGISITQNLNLANLNAGLAFGGIKSSSVSFTNSGEKPSTLKGSIYQNVNNSASNVNLGGIAGEVAGGSLTEVQGFSVDVTMAKASEDTNYLKALAREFEKDQKSYANINGLEASGTDTNVGGFFGSVSGGRVTVYGSCDITGNIAINSTSASSSAGGLIGKTSSEVTATTNIENNLNMSITSAQASIGGLIGNMYEEVSSSNAKIEGVSKSILSYDGIVLANVNQLNFGGAIGYVSRNNSNVSISGYAYGGALKIYGENIDQASVNVGGVVGAFDISNLSVNAGELLAEDARNKISNCYTYGDIFVNYDQNETYMMNAYNFGGIVGVSNNVSLQNCYSLLTSFNNKLTVNATTRNNGIGTYNVGALVGANSDTAITAYDNNYYSSDVCMAYQVESGNFDCYYGKEGSFVGYVNQDYINSDDVKQEPTKLVNDVGILSKFQEFLGDAKTVDLTLGTKLNPFIWGTEGNINCTDKHIRENEEDPEENGITIDGKTHNIKWISLQEDMTMKNAIANNFNQIAFVGNGHIISRADETAYEGAGSQSVGALVNSMGSKPADTAVDVNFSLISGLLLNLDIQKADVNTTGDTKQTSFYGGVAGTMEGNSFIYGVGVNGELSVGGNNTSLRLGGIVGQMNSGFVNECYMNADISYRAAAGGLVSGIATMQGQNTIKSTYSGGEITTYLDINIYTLAYTQNAAKNNNYLMDSYSYTAIKRNLYEENIDTTPGQNFFINLEDNASNVLNTYGEVLHGCYDVEKTTVTATGAKAANANVLDWKSIENMSLSFNGTNSANTSLDPTTSEATGTTTWYFSPYTNYGYASHGFGYLKNVSTFTREENISTSSETETKVENNIKSYTYNKETFQNIINADYDEKYFLGVNNVGKLEQMVGLSTEKTTYSFVLINSLTMGKLFAEKKTETSSTSATQTAVDAKFNLDGQNNTLDFENATLKSSIFSSITGNVENLRITNVNVTISSGSATIGVLAGKMTGNLNNVTVVGNLNVSTISNTYIGGVVGVLEGNVNCVNSLVNITNASEQSISGGVVGYLKGAITNSSNSGIINNTASKNSVIRRYSKNNNGLNILTNVKGINGSTTENDGYANITGGVAGYVENGTVSNSYNANAVMSGFSISGGQSYIAGGVVGYMESGTITESYNSALVGAGNYDNVNTNFAGGIFGYGCKGVSVKYCANDGPVQAIGTVNKENYKLSTELKSGSKDVEKYTGVNDLEDLVYDVTITYNQGETRKVFAYGIGVIGINETTITNANETTFSGNYSSTDNIKNDGNVGEISDTQILKFDRKTMLDSDGNYYGKFKANTNVHVNGLDAYGFPARVYMTDTMTRIYSTNLEAYRYKDFYGNEIFDENNYPFSDKSTWWFNANDVYTINSTYTYTYDQETDSYGYEQNMKGWAEDGDNLIDKYLQWWDKDAYAMAADTEYYSSVSFAEYNNIVRDENGDYIGLVGYDSNNSKSKIIENKKDENGKEISPVDVNSKISEIDKLSDNSSESLLSVTIDGKVTAVVKSEGNFTSVYVPYKYTASAEFDASLMPANISKANFSIVTNNVNQPKPQFYEMTLEKDKNNKFTGKVNLTLYYAQELTNFGNTSIQVVYTTTPTEVNLYKSNIKQLGSNYLIYLKDNEVEYSKIDGKLTSVKISYEYNGENEIDLDNPTISEETPHYIEIPDTNTNFTDLLTRNDFDSLNAKLKLTFTSFTESFIDAYISISAGTENTAEFEINEVLSGDTSRETFKGFETMKLNALLYENDFTQGSDSWSLELSSWLTKISERLGFSENTTRLVFGIDENFCVKYESGAWTVSNNKLSYGNLEIEGDKLIITAASGVTVKDIIEALLKSDIYIKLPDEKITFGKSLNGDRETMIGETGFAYVSTYTAADVGNFSAGDATNYAQYKGSNFEKETGLETVSYFGVDFYQKTVTFTFTRENGATIKLKNISSKPQSFELFTSDYSYFIQGSLEAGQAQNLDIGNGNYTLNSFSSVTMNQEFERTIDENGIVKYVPGEEIGDKSKFKYQINSSTYVDTKGTEDKSDDVTETISTLNLGEELSDYILKKGEKVNPVTNTLEGFISTSKVTIYDTKTKAQKVFKYVYTIYDSGMITIEFDDYVEDKEGESGANAKMYIIRNVNGITKFGEVAIKCTKKEVTDSYIDENDKEIDEIKTIIEKEYTFPEISGYGSLTSDPKDITYTATMFDKGSQTLGIDCVGGYFDENSIIFIKEDISSNADKNKLLTTKTVENEYTRHFDLNLYYSSVPKEITIEKSTLEYLADNGTLEVQQENGDWTIKEKETYVEEDVEKERYVFTTEKYGKTNYNYRYSACEKTDLNFDEVKDEDEKTVTNYKIIVLDNDISTTKNFGDNGKIILGSGYNVKYSAIQNDKSLFDNNNSTITNLNIVGNMNVPSNSENTGLTLAINENSSKLKNINIYGNIRNFNATKTVLSAIGSTEDGSIENINSYISLIGLDNGYDEKIGSIKDTLGEKGFKTETVYNESTKTWTEINVPIYTSHNVIIAGNGLKGKNGDSSKTAGGNGKTGSAGGKGVSITVNEASFKGLARAGVGAVGGYGGNGANGKYNFIMKKSLGGGGGGAYGSVGEEGKILSDKSTAENLVELSSNLTVRDLDKKQFGGNGGVGGLGRIDKDLNTYYTSAVGGNAGGNSGGDNGHSGKNKIWKDAPNSNRIAFGLSTGLSMHNADSLFASKYGSKMGWRIGKIKENVSNKMSDINSELDGIYENLYGDISTRIPKTSKVYLSLQMYDENAGFMWADRRLLNWKRVMWTSGETLNSGGSFGVASLS